MLHWKRKVLISFLILKKHFVTKTNNGRFWPKKKRREKKKHTNFEWAFCGAFSIAFQMNDMFSYQILCVESIAHIDFGRILIFWLVVVVASWFQRDRWPFGTGMYRTERRESDDVRFVYGKFYVCLQSFRRFLVLRSTFEVLLIREPIFGAQLLVFSRRAWFCRAILIWFLKFTYRGGSFHIGLVGIEPRCSALRASPRTNRR